jgi:putative Ca2+/H+ antiporter (TMEM165/GDT1 family)
MSVSLILSTSALFLAAYWTVLAAEIIGDKSICTITSLASRYRCGGVFAGMAAAFGGKMLVAVALGNTMAMFPARWIAISSAITFFLAALFIQLRSPETPVDTRFPACWSSAPLVAFSALFFTEWGDPGQIAAAAFTAQCRQPLLIWLGGTLALVTKGGLALTVGRKLRDRIPERTFRSLACASCCVLGLISLTEGFFP